MPEVSVYQFVHSEADRQVRPFEMYPTFTPVDYPDPDIILRGWMQRGHLPSNNCQVYGAGLQSQGLPRGWRVISLAPGSEGIQAGEDILIGDGQDPYEAVAQTVRDRLTKLGGGCINALCVVR